MNKESTELDRFIHRLHGWTQMEDHRDVFCLRQGKDFIKKPGADEYATRTVDLIGTFSYHLKKVFADSELEEDSVIRNFRITAADGKSYNTKHPH